MRMHIVFKVTQAINLISQAMTCEVQTLATETTRRYAQPSANNHKQLISLPSNLSKEL